MDTLPDEADTQPVSNLPNGTLDGLGGRQTIYALPSTDLYDYLKAVKVSVIDWDEHIETPIYLDPAGIRKFVAYLTALVDKLDPPVNDERDK